MSIYIRRFLSSSNVAAQGTTTKKQSSVIRRIAGWSVLFAVPAYAGATAYAQEDKEFKRFFRDNVLFGDSCLKLYKKVFSSSEQKEQIKSPKAETVTVAIKPLNPATESKPKSNEEPVKVNDSLSVFSTRIQGILDEMEKVVVSGETKSADAFILKLQDSLEQLRNHTETLSQTGQLDVALHRQSLQFLKLLSGQLKTFQGLLLANAERSDAQTAALRKEMQLQMEKTVSEAQEKQKLESAREFEVALKTAQDLQAAEWSRQARFLVDSERDGRLARLESLELQAKNLEISLKAVQQGSIQAFAWQRAQLALQSVRQAISEGSHEIGQVDGNILLKALDPETFSLGQELQEDGFLRLLCESGRVAVSSSSSSSSKPNNFTSKPIQSSNALSQKFHDICQEIRCLAFLPQDQITPETTFRSHVTSWILARATLATPVGSFPAGDSVEAILGRANYWIDRSNLDMAAREMNSLRGWPRAMAREWLKQTRDHLSVVQAIDAIDAYVNLKKLEAI